MTTRQALDAARRALQVDSLAPLVGRRVRLAPTGHVFKVLGFSADGDRVEVLDGRTRRYLPAALLRRAQAAGLLAVDPDAR